MLNTGSLSGVTVIDLSRLLPGPYCSMILADHGARVIAVEDKRFQNDVSVNTVMRNKEHMSLDLKSDTGRSIFLRLVKNADVLIEGFRPGVVDRLGVDYDTICRVNPGIIYCSITGYGQTGPYRDRPGHDVNFMSLSGVLGLIGEADRPPSIPGIQIADIAGGGMNAAIGILMALYAREKTGQGQCIDISMTDCMVGMMPVPLFFKKLIGQSPRRAEGILSHRYAFYNTYETSDGGYISIGALEPRFWKTFCEKMDLTDYIPLQFDEARRKEIIERIRSLFLTKTRGEWEKVFGDHEICWAPIISLEEAITHPYHQARGMFVDIEEKDGKKSTAIGVPIKMSATPGSVRTPAISFGENTIDVLKEIGYSAEEIEGFKKENVI